MTEHEAIEESIAHWRRMIAWMEKKDPQAEIRVSVGNLDADMIEEMHEDLGEAPGVRDCALCQMYIKCSISAPSKEICRRDCPLGRVYGTCNISNKTNGYQEVSKADTVSEWLAGARRLLSQLESLLRNDESPRTTSDRRHHGRTLL